MVRVEESFFQKLSRVNFVAYLLILSNSIILLSYIFPSLFLRILNIYYWLSALAIMPDAASSIFYMLHLPQKLGFFFNICWVLAALAAAIGMLRFNNKARKFSIIFCGINAFSVFIFFLIPVFRSGKPQKFLTFGFPIALALFYIFYLTRIGIKERFKKENE